MVETEVVEVPGDSDGGEIGKAGEDVAEEEEGVVEVDGDGVEATEPAEDGAESTGNRAK